MLVPAPASPADVRRFLRPLDLDAVLRALPDPVGIFDGARRLVAGNAPFLGLAAEWFDRAPLLGETIDQLVERADGPTREFWQGFLVRAVEGTPVMGDVSYRSADRKRSFSVSASPLEPGRRLAPVLLTVRDITDARRTTQRDVMELAFTRVFLEGGSLEESLDAALELLCELEGWDVGTIWLVRDGGLEAAAIHHDGSAEACEYARAMEEMRFSPGIGNPGRAWVQESVVWIPDLTDETGALRWPHAARMSFRCVVAVPLKEAGTVSGVLELHDRKEHPVDEEAAEALEETGRALGRLIDRKKAELERVALEETVALRGSEWERTFDAIQLPIFLTDVEGRIVRLNEAARGVPAAEPPREGLSVGRLGRGEPWKTIHDLVSAVVEGDFDCTAQAADEETNRYWDLSASVFDAAAPGSARVIVVLRDVTTMVTLQESVRRGEQLAAMGELVAGVAHEVRNPLFGMSVTLDTFGPAVEGIEDGRELVSGLRAWVSRLNVLMEDLLEYGKTWNVELSEGSPRDSLEQALASSRPHALAAGVDLVTLDELGGAVMLMDANRLTHAFQNVILNAIQHAPRASVVEVRATSLLPSAEPRIELTVRDRGPGFRPADLPRIFQPFFTRRRGGTGLGLAVVQRIAEEHGGTVRVENDPGGGALVRLQFPLFQRREARKGSSPGYRERNDRPEGDLREARQG